jgi:methylthioribose-1-phosphate isomerase
VTGLAEPVSDGVRPAPAAPASVTATPSAAAADPERRAFFFQFGRQAVSAVGQVAGMADAASRTASAVANELLGRDEPASDPARFTRSGATTDPVVSTATPAAEDAFRSAYRLAGDELVLLDQRTLPDSLDEVVARRGSDVAYYLRLGVARGGPLMAQVAAYGLALTSAERADQPAHQRQVELRRTAQALAEARPSARLPAWAMARMQDASTRVPESNPGADVAAALRTEADAIAADIRDWQAAIAAGIVSVLPEPAGRPLTVLLHGSQGALAGGLVGSGITALGQLRDAGREPRIFLTEGRPFMDGARLASWELRQAGLAHQLVPDAAAAWLLAHETVDAVLLSAEWTAANGDVGALVGSRSVAQLASASPSARPRPLVIVSGLSATRDPDSPDGGAIPVELRPARDLSAYLAGVPVRSSDALVPASDVIPATAIDLIVTERGVSDPGTT